jgi:hypothetical protein
MQDALQTLHWNCVLELLLLLLLLLLVEEINLRGKPHGHVGLEGRANSK